jgi:ADP-ribose pyrophosphatase YjhB (NUDIX family)
MYVTDDMLAEARGKYGTPDVLHFQTTCSEQEMNVITGSQKHGRAHDITLFIFNGNRIAVTAKHPYPAGLYRPPSGGLTPGESIEDGAAREAYEETGLSIRLTTYILRIEAGFSSPTRHVDWTSHVFLAAYIGGEIQPHDHDEIREARWADLNEFPEFARIMRTTHSGGLHYRAFLQEEVLRRLPEHMVSQ